VTDFPTPSRHEQRGDFPQHSDRPQRLLTLEEARALARQRLAAWVLEHGCQPGAHRAP
jgi:hypothetical protein